MISFKNLLVEDSEDVTTRTDIIELLDSLDDEFGTENVDYDEIMEVLLTYIETKYDIEDSEDMDEARVEYFDKDLTQMKQGTKQKLNKFQLARKAKKYYRKNKRKLLKKQKKYRKKIKSGKHIPKQHDRIQH